MTTRVNPEMLILAREARGLTQAALAELLSLTQATVSRYEAGLVDVPVEHLAAFGRVLGRPKSFFYWRDRLYGSSCLYHRKRSKIAVRDLKAIHAHVNILRMQTERLLRYADVHSRYAFHRLDASRYGGPEGCARKLRELWQLPTGPIRSVAGCIESAGGIIFRCSFQDVKVDGISQWPLDAPTLPPVFFVNAQAPGDRSRLTLCHEVGHIVMHHLPTDDPEEEANRFASEFLMPANEIGPELSDMTLQKAAALKGYWKTSMQSIIFRAHRLGKITQAKYEYLFKQLSALGYRKCEPVPFSPEDAGMFRDLFSVFRQAHAKNTRDIAESLGMLEDELLGEYWQALAGLRLLA
jgi:Zn-dependent peptidase ImmA (M78 family)/transcriptional regulator with XRE-family HTH domain